MICPQCGLYVSDPSAATCPRCGQALSSRPGSMPGSEQVLTAASFPPTQPVRTEAPTPTTAQWMRPAIAPEYQRPIRKRSRTRRNIISLLVVVAIVIACAAFVYSSFIAPAKEGTTTPLASNVIFSDTLANDTSGWSNDSNHCFYQGNAYHVKNSIVCFAPTGNISDASITVQAEQVAGNTDEGYGISLRRVSEGNRYDFDITGNSDWAFFKVVNNTPTTLADFTSNSAIKGGLNTINTLRVVAQGAHFTFYVNGTQVGEVDDTTYASGETGLSAGGVTTEVAYTDFEIDKVS